jgi:HTH-type transcriptional regulator/antitoxin HigA
MNIRPIRSDSDHKAALARIEAVWGASEGTPEGDELDILAILVEEFENRHYPVEELEPIPFLLAHMKATGLTQTDLGKLFGSVPALPKYLDCGAVCRRT